MAEWGLRLTPEKKTEHYGIGCHGVDFDVGFEQGEKKDPLFYTDPKLSDMLGEKEELQGEKLGYIRYTVYENERYYRLSRYYPFGNPEKPQDPLQKEALDSLRGRGINYRLWQKSIQYLKDQYPGYDYKEDTVAMNPHRHQLEMLSISPGEVIPPDKILAKIDKKLKQKH